MLCPKKCALSGDSLSSSDRIAALGAKHLPISLSRQGLNAFSELKLLREIYSYAKVHKPHYIINYTIKPGIYGSIAGRMARVPFIASNITGLGYVFTDNSTKARVIRSIVKVQYLVAFKFNKVVFFQNKDDCSEFLKLGLVKERQVGMLNGSGIDLQKFRLNNVRARKTEEALTRVVFVGRLLKDKGIRELLDAAEKLKDFPIKISIVGAHDNNPNCIERKAFDSAVSAGFVEYLGVLNDVRGVLANADVFVLPSYREGTPRSTLEAMAMSLPIVTTDVPGCRETVINEENGFLVPAYDSSELAQRILDLHLDREMAVSMGLRSRVLVEQKFDVVKVNETILSHLGIYIE